MVRAVQTTPEAIEGLRARGTHPNANGKLDFGVSFNQKADLMLKRHEPL
jgi:hypothetical protein